MQRIHSLGRGSAEKLFRRRRGAGLFWLGLTLLCGVLGFLAAAMTAGAVARLGAFPVVLGGLLLLWAMPKRNESPDALLNGLLLVLLTSIHLWPEYIFSRLGGLPAISPTKIAWLAFLSISLFFVLSCRQPMARLFSRCAAHRTFVGSVAFLMLWRIVTSLAGPEPLFQLWQLGSELLTFYLLFFLALAILRDERDVFRLLAVLVVVAAAQVLLASYEAFVQHTLFEKFISVGQQDPGTLQSILMDKFRGGHYRAQGTFTHPMVLAEFMAMMMPLAVAVFLGSKSLALRSIAAGLVPVAFVMIVSSRSRAGIAVVLISLLLLGLLAMIPRNRGTARNASSSGLLIAALVLPVLVAVTYFAGSELLTLVVGRNTSEANSTMTRMLMLQQGIPLLFDSPVLGYGNAMGAVKLGFFDGVRYNIDSYFLSTALDAGVPGITAFVMVFAGSALLGFRGYMRRNDLAGTASGLIAVSIMMLIGVKSVLSIPSGFSLAYVLIASLVVLREAPPAGALASDRHTLRTRLRAGVPG